MKKKIFLFFFVVLFFIVFKNQALAEGICKCKTINLAGDFGKTCFLDVNATFTCSGSTPNYQCAIQENKECVPEGTCECVASPPGGGEGGPDTTQGENTPVSIPGYPTETTKGLLSEKDLTLGMIIGKALTYVYVVAGMALLLVLIMGGISLMTAAGDPKKIEAGYGKIKDGLIGFLIIFVSYMATQLVEVVLGVKIL